MSARAAGRPAQPMTRALAWTARAAFVLAIGDLGTLAGLLNHATVLAALSDPGAASVLPKLAGGLGMMMGVFAGFCYALWPIGSISGRQPAELQALKLLALALLVVHPVVLILLAADMAAHGYAVIIFVFLSAPVSVLATPLLLPLARFRPNAPAPARGSPPPGSVPSAGRTALVALALVLGCGGVVLAFVSPLRALVPFALAAGIGARLARQKAQRDDPAARPLEIPPTVGLGALNVAGLVAVPPLYALDAVAAAVLLALHRAQTLGAFASIVEGSMLILLVGLPFTLGPLMAALPYGGRRTEPFRKVASLLLALGHAALAAALGAAAFVPAAGFAPQVRLILAPLAWALVLALPLAALLAASAVAPTRSGP